MKKSITFSFFMLLVYFSQGQQLIGDYLTLDLPISDSEVIGKVFNQNLFSESGISSYNVTKSRSLDSLHSADTVSLKIGVTASIKKILSLNMGISNSHIENVSLSNLEVWTCNRYEKMSFSEGRKDYVIAAVVAKGLNFTFSKNINDSMKISLDSLITKTFNIAPQINYGDKNAHVMLGKDLIVAVRLLHVSKTTAFDISRDENLSISNTKIFELKETRNDIQKLIRFADLPTLPKYLFPNDSIARNNQGCFLLICVQLGRMINGEPEQDTLVYCPSCREFKQSTIKPDCPDSYSPDAKYSGLNPRVLVSVNMGKPWIPFTSSKIEQYIVTIQDANVSYLSKPRNTNSFSNYVLDQVTANIIIKKLILDYQID
ncbi:MAG TPA: hypothetical protein VK772_16310 [Puia sp.]|jgi:hypothetical protein|nr:hypothetical protein [Puia sp.]